jgi:hypothetical protein
MAALNCVGRGCQVGILGPIFTYIRTGTVVALWRRWCFGESCSTIEKNDRERYMTIRLKVYSDYI